MNKNTAAHVIDDLHKNQKKKQTGHFFGPLSLTKQGNKYILVISDLFTKWTEAIAIPNQEITTICKAFVDNCITNYGTPLQIH